MPLADIRWGLRFFKKHISNQGNRLRKKRPITSNGQGIIERPGTTLTLACERILNRIIRFQHLHAEFTKHIDDNSGMPHPHMHIILVEAAIQAPMKIVLNCPMLSLQG
jgi:hypothetical protein